MIGADDIGSSIEFFACLFCMPSSSIIYMIWTVVDKKEDIFFVVDHDVLMRKKFLMND